MCENHLAIDSEKLLIDLIKWPSYSENKKRIFFNAHSVYIYIYIYIYMQQRNETVNNHEP